jgi:hypothetical protein
MPLYADIRINDTPIKTIAIGRSAGGTDPDDINTYIAVEIDPDGALDWWDENHAKYIHRYGDGAEVCLLRGLKALGYDTDLPQTKNSKKWDGNGRKYR